MFTPNLPSRVSCRDIEPMCAPRLHHRLQLDLSQRIILELLRAVDQRQLMRPRRARRLLQLRLGLVAMQASTTSGNSSSRAVMPSRYAFTILRGSFALRRKACVHLPLRHRYFLQIPHGELQSPEICYNEEHRLLHVCNTLPCRSKGKRHRMHLKPRHSQRWR